MKLFDVPRRRTPYYSDARDASVTRFERTTMESAARPLATALIALATLLYAFPALAYLDPGTGSIVLQGIIAVIAAGAVALKVYWRRLRSVFGRKPGPDTTEKRQG